MYHTFFTSQPRQVYLDAANRGDLVRYAIGIGLMRSQLIFWTSNVVVATAITIRSYENSEWPIVCMTALSAFLYYTAIGEAFYLREKMK